MCPLSLKSILQTSKLQQTCSTDWSGAKEMPRMGRNTLPNWMIWLTELRMMSTGTANPTPLLAPEGEYIAVLMPAWQ